MKKPAKPDGIGRAMGIAIDVSDIDWEFGLHEAIDSDCFLSIDLTVVINLFSLAP